MRSLNLLFSCLLLLPVSAFALPPQDGMLDPTFDGDGKVRLALDQGGNDIDVSTSVVATATGAYVFGNADIGFNNNVSTITRLKLDGSVDVSGYGDGGTVYVEMLDGFYDDYKLASGAVQADGKLVAIGQATTGNDTDMLVCRFLTDGALDEDFGDEGGCKRIDFENVADDICFGICAESAQAIAIQPNQRIVVAGTYNATGLGSGLVVAARLNAAGDYDPGFTHPSLNNAPGRVLIDVSGFNSTVARVLIDDAERILIGYSKSYSYDDCDYAFAVKRILSSGGQDNSFDGGGSAEVDFNLGGTTPPNSCLNWRDRLTDMALLDDGSILLGGEVEVTPAGDTYVPAFMGAVAKITSQGILDTGWSNQGKRLVWACDFCGSSRYTGFAVQSDGKMLLAGQTIVPAAPNDTTDAFVIRLNPDGLIDGTFGDGSLLNEAGRGSYGFDETPEGSYEFLVDLAMQNGAPLLLTTTRAHNTIDIDMGLFRLRNDRIFWNDFELD